MPFILLVFFSALLLEIIGSYISITGLAARTGIIVVIIAIALDLAKIVIASALYKKWKNLNILLKIYLLPVLLVLISVTSAGAFGYLSQEFGKTILSQEKNQSQLLILEDERTRKLARRDQINAQIDRLPSDQVNQRRRLIETYAVELESLNTSITRLEQEIPQLKISSIEETGNNGTIGSISKNLNLPPEVVIKYLSLFMVLFIDPLAIVLLILANFLIEERKKEKAQLLQSNVLVEKAAVQEEPSGVSPETSVAVIEPQVNKSVDSVKESVVKYVENKENSNLTKNYQEKDNKVLSANILPEKVLPDNKNLTESYMQKDNAIMQLYEHTAAPVVVSPQQQALTDSYIQKDDTIMQLYDEVLRDEGQTQAVQEMNESVSTESVKEVSPIDKSAMIKPHTLAEGVVVPSKRLNPPKYDFNALLDKKANDQDLQEMQNFISSQRN